MSYTYNISRRCTWCKQIVGTMDTFTKEYRCSATCYWELKPIKETKKIKTFEGRYSN